MKIAIQLWIFVSALLLVVGFFLKSPLLSVLALIVAVIAQAKYKKTANYSDTSLKAIIERRRKVS